MVNAEQRSDAVHRAIRAREKWAVLLAFVCILPSEDEQPGWAFTAVQPDVASRR